MGTRPDRLTLLLALLLPAIGGASAPPAGPFGFRGDGSGVFDGGRLADGGPAWVARLDGDGNASPVLFGGLVVVTVEPSTVLAFDQRSGRRMWSRNLSISDAYVGSRAVEVTRRLREAETDRRKLASLREERQRLLRRARRAVAAPEIRADLSSNTSAIERIEARLRADSDLFRPDPGNVVGRASATPVVIGDRVVVLFGDGVVAALGRDGRSYWTRHLPAPTTPMRGYEVGTAASLAAHGADVFVPYGELWVLDAATGRTSRSLGPIGDFGSPVVARHGPPHLVAPDGRIWRLPDAAPVGAIQSVLFTSPCVVPEAWVVSGMIDGGDDDARPRVSAFAVPATSSDPPRALWSVPLGGRAVYASPLVVRDTVWVVDADGVVHRFARADGAPVERLTLGLQGPVFSSPTLAGNDVLLSDESGRALVVDAMTAKVRREHRLPAPVRASPVASREGVFMRAGRELHYFPYAR
jgi:outer membrane protein assembly factor BamB